MKAETAPACKAIPISGTECISKPSSMTGSASLLHIPPIFDHQMHSLPLLVNLTTQPYCNLAQLNAIFMNTAKCRPIPIPGHVDILVFKISIRLCLISCKLLLFTSGSHIPAQVMPRPIAREALAANEKVDWLHLRSTWPDPATLFVCKRKRFIFRGCLSNFPFHTTSTPLDCVGIQFLPSPASAGTSSAFCLLGFLAALAAFQTKPNLTWPTYLNDLPSHNRISQLWPTPITFRVHINITFGIQTYNLQDPALFKG